MHVFRQDDSVAILWWLSGRQPPHRRLGLPSAIIVVIAVVFVVVFVLFVFVCAGVGVRVCAWALCGYVW